MLATRFQQYGHRVASQPMISPLHLTESISDMLTFSSIKVFATGAGVISVIDDMYDMQWHVQGTGEFTGEDQRGPAGWVAVVTNNKHHGNLPHSAPAGTISLDGGSGRGLQYPGRRSIASIQA